MGWYYATCEWLRTFCTAALIATPAIFDPAGTAAQGNLILSGLSFPPRIAGTERGEHRNFEREMVGLGHSVEYKARDWKINVYIYDLQKTSIPDDIESTDLAAQFEQARGDILAAEKQGIYKNVSMVHSFTVAGLDGKPRFLCGSFAFRHKSIGDVDSFLCLTSLNGKYLKFRATTGRSEESETRFRQYLGAWIEHIWPDG